MSKPPVKTVTAHATRVRGVVLALLLALVGLSVIPSSASAARSKYGPWFPEPGRSKAVYQADLDPLNERESEISEQKTFSCVMPNGETVSDETREALGSLFYQATNVYAGKLDYDDWGGNDDLSDERKRIKNLGYPTGIKGMREFLADERALLRKGVWVPYSERKAQDADDNDGRDQDDRSEFAYQIGDTGIEIVPDKVEDYEDKVETSKKTQRKLIELVNWKAENPLHLGTKTSKNDTKYLPEGCSLGNVADSGEMGIGDWLDNPPEAFLSTLLYGIGKPVDALYHWATPNAWPITFWTPHSERGDTFLNIDKICAPGDRDSSQCLGSRPLGFDKKNLNRIDKDASWYISIAQLLQWLISGTYFLILFTAAVLFIFRGNRSSSLNVLQLLPKLLLSILVTLTSSFIIGAVISFANLTTEGIFDLNDNQTIGAMNNALLNAGLIVGSDNTILTQMIEIIVGAAVTWFSIIFLAVSVLRQVGLIALIILAPLAAFCLINDRWRPRFVMWFKALAVIAFLPVVMAFLLKIGISINPVLADPKEPTFGGLEGVMGIVLIIATFWAMARAAKLGMQMIFGGSGSLSGAFLRSGGGLLTRSGAALSDRAAGTKAEIPGAALGAALGGLGGAMTASGRLSQWGDRAEAKLIPTGRMSGGPAGQPAIAGLLGKEAVSGPGTSNKVSTGYSALDRGAQRVNDRIQRFMDQRARAAAASNPHRQTQQPRFARRLSAEEVAELQRVEDAMRQQGWNKEQIEREIGGKVEYDRKAGGYVQRQDASAVIRDFQEKRRGVAPAPQPTAAQQAANSGSPMDRPVGSATPAGGARVPEVAAAQVNEGEVVGQMSHSTPSTDTQKKTIKVAESPEQVSSPADKGTQQPANGGPSAPQGAHTGKTPSSVQTGQVQQPQPPRTADTGR